MWSDGDLRVAERNAVDGCRSTTLWRYVRVELGSCLRVHPSGAAGAGRATSSRVDATLTDIAKPSDPYSRGDDDSRSPGTVGLMLVN